LIDLRLTKIVCTIGPSSDSEDMLKQLILDGMDIARLNFSHSDHSTHEAVFNKLRELNDSLAIAIDISGPKIRLGKLKEKYILEANDKVQLTTEIIEGTKNLLPVNYSSLSEEIKKDSFIFMNDGFVKLKVQSIEDNLINCVVIDGGEISSHKGINVPDADLSIHVPTKKDIVDIEKACELETDFLFISFVRCADDLKKVNELVETSLKKPIPLIAKIEHQDALKNIKNIMKYCNGLMVARGDLAVEIGPAKVPVVQKNLINLGMSYAKPVIVATQMLESMTKESLPTRAEASDVAHAVFDGADALMLSSETATGKHPLQVVKVMKDIINEAEKDFKCTVPDSNNEENPIGFEIGQAAVQLRKRMSSKAIIALTQTGYSARMVYRNRVPLPIYVVTPEQTTMRFTRLLWGVKPILHHYETEYEQLVFSSIHKFHSEKMINPEDTVILVAGSIIGLAGKTNTIQVLNVHETLAGKH